MKKIIIITLLLMMGLVAGKTSITLDENIDDIVITQEELPWD